MTDWFQNGQRIEQLAVDDRGLQYGDGLFETIAVRAGEPRLWPLHVERLVSGCRRLDIVLPAAAELKSQLAAALRSAGLQDATAKIIVSAGTGTRGYGRDSALVPTTLVGVFPAVRYPAAFYRDGVDTRICATQLAIGSVTAGLKTLNRLEQVLASAELDRSKHFEGFTLDADGNIICGTMSNVFIVADKAVMTPSLDACGVAGVMRHHVIDTLAATGRQVVVQPIVTAELQRADEVFLSNSQFGVMPVKSCGDFRWPVGEITGSLLRNLAATDFPECGA